jgi:hypothetical protein
MEEISTSWDKYQLFSGFLNVLQFTRQISNNVSVEGFLEDIFLKGFGRDWIFYEKKAKPFGIFLLGFEPTLTYS